MQKSMMFIALALSLALPAAGQNGGAGAEKAPAADARPAPRPKLSDAARSALAAAKELAAKVKGLEDAERASAIETAAKAYDQVAADFAGEGAAAAQASFLAAGLWRRHGSFVLANQDYLAAARLDPSRYAQQATLGAADMQRRLDQHEEALATYGQVIAIAPGTAAAQRARLWQGRLMLTLGRRDAAIAAFRGALEAAPTPRQALDAVNYLARALVDTGDLEGAAAAIRHAEQVVATAIAADPTGAANLQKALDGLSARKALQRARDKAAGAAADARKLESATKKAGGGQ